MGRSASRRQPILEAMIRVAGSKGYRATSVAGVVAEAGASRTTFYKHFDDKQDCFLAAFDLCVERILAETLAVCDGVRPWRERMRSGLQAVVELFARDPALARTAIIEVAAAGAAARRRHSAAVGRFARLLEPDRDLPRQAELPASTALMAVSAVAGLIFDELQAGRAAELPQHLPELEFALLVPFIGPRAAAEAHELSAYSPSP
jgi:AcrR family transcriptional regulator